MNINENAPKINAKFLQNKHKVFAKKFNSLSKAKCVKICIMSLVYLEVKTMNLGCFNPIFNENNKNCAGHRHKYQSKKGK